MGRFSCRDERRKGEHAPVFGLGFPARYGAAGRAGGRITASGQHGEVSVAWSFALEPRVCVDLFIVMAAPAAAK